ncbi:hypothetical protein C8Q74DRAFT_1436655 [Fomes fomentarius]|nr:hypothetical protein C8Q74DRAFT_1436655 [Fomes fomentarius]
MRAWVIDMDWARRMRLARIVDRPRDSKTSISTTKYNFKSMLNARTGNNVRQTGYKAKDTHAGMGVSTWTYKIFDHPSMNECSTNVKQPQANVMQGEARTRPHKYDSHQRSTNGKQRKKNGIKTKLVQDTHAGIGYRHGLGASHAAGPRKIFDHPTKNGKQPKTKVYIPRTPVRAWAIDMDLVKRATTKHNPTDGQGMRAWVTDMDWARRMRLVRGVDRPRGSKT